MAEVEVEVSEWSEPPFGLLDLVSDGLVSNADFIRFGSVCKSWRCVFLDNPRPPQLPLLMIPLYHVDGSSDGYCNALEEEEKKMEEEDDDEGGGGGEEMEKEKKSKEGRACRYKRSLYSMTEHMVYKFSVPVPSNVYCFGSSHGWLTTVAMDDDTYPVRLFNPFLPINHNEIKLPSLRTMPQDEIFKIKNYAYASKFVVSSNLTATSTTASNHYLVMAIDGRCRGLVVWKPSEETWLPVEVQDLVTGFYDCIHYKGRFYAVNWKGEVVVMVDNNPKAEFLAPPPPDTAQYASTKYLVQASGDIFQVQRDLDDSNINRIFTRDFYVYKLLDYDIIKLGEDREMKPTWKEVDTLDGHAFFIGDSTSMSVMASKFPGYRPNCIYFTDDFIDSFFFKNSKPKDVGVFDVIDRSFDYNFHGQGSFHFRWPNPIWIEPTICRGSSHDQLTNSLVQRQ